MFAVSNVFAEGNDANTVFLLHSDTTNGSTIFVDSSSAGNGGSGNNISISGNVIHSTAASKFGSSSIYFDQSSYLQITDSDDFSFGTGDFTIDFWVNCAVVNDWTMMFFMDQIETIQMMYSTGNYGFCFQTGEANDGYNASKVVPVAGEWNHLALVRNGATVTSYINGTVGKVKTVNAVSMNDPTVITIGLGGSGWNTKLNGYIDEFRISKGIARWTEDFTPPTAPYGDAAPEPGGGGGTISVVSGQGMKIAAGNRIVIKQ